jgi:hypothetical protein
MGKEEGDKRLAWRLRAWAGYGKRWSQLLTVCLSAERPIGTSSAAAGPGAAEVAGLDA